MEQSERKKSRPYSALVWTVKKCYPAFEVAGTENIPSEPSVIVGNHAQMHGPLACELYFPGKHYTWCAGQMMNAKEIQPYAYKDFWSYKPGCIKWFYKLLSYAIVPLAVFIFSHANVIGVYRDTRIISTFRTTLRRLEEGANVIIFPEHDRDGNHILCEFQTGFIDLAKLYYRKTGQELSFVPMYVAPKLKKIYLGKPVSFCHDTDIAEERERICRDLGERITDIACSLPRHRVVPYRNLSPKYYSYNTEDET